MSEEDYWSKIIEERVVFPPFAYNHYKVYVVEQHDIFTGEALGFFSAFADPFEQPFTKAALSPFHVVGKQSKEEAMEAAKAAVDKSVFQTTFRDKHSRRPVPKLTIKDQAIDIADYKCCRIYISKTAEGFLAFCVVMEQPFRNEMVNSASVSAESKEHVLEKAKAAVEAEIAKAAKHDSAGGIDNIPY